MYPSVLAAKSNARNFLKGNFLSAIAASLSFIAVLCLISLLRTLIAVSFKIGDTSFALTVDILHPVKLLGFLMLSLVTFALICTLAGPMYLGVFRWFWHLTAAHTLPLGQIFYYFSRGLFRKTVDFIARFLLKLILYSLLFFLPYILTVTVSSPQLYHLFGGTVPLFMAALAPLTTVFSIGGTVLVILYLFRIYLIIPIYCNDDSITVGEAFLLARYFSYYTAAGYLSFLFSFFGWLLLCLLAIPMLYAIPYFFCANAMYCRFALNYGMQINRFQKT